MKHTYNAIMPGMFFAVKIHANSLAMAKREFRKRFCLNRLPDGFQAWLVYE